MEATVAPRAFEGEKARRIISAMRASVSTRARPLRLDHVAREAGVSPGLLHYYFGSKERLLVEVVRHDCEVRIETMDERLARAGSLDEIVQAIMIGLEEFIEDELGSQAVIYEMLSASRHSEEIRLELAELYRRWRASPRPAQKQREEVVELRAEPGLWPPCCSPSATVWASRSPRTQMGSPAAFELGILTARRLLGAGD